MLIIHVLLFSVLECASGFAPTLTAFLVLRAFVRHRDGRRVGHWGQPHHGIHSGPLARLRIGTAAVGLFLRPIYWLRCFSESASMSWDGEACLSSPSCPPSWCCTFEAKVSESPGWTPPRVDSKDDVTRRPASGANMRRYLYAIALMAAAGDLQSWDPGSVSDLPAHPTRLSVHEVSMIAIVYNIGAILGCLCGGTLSQWLGRRRRGSAGRRAGSGADAILGDRLGCGLPGGTAFCMQFLVQSMFWGHARSSQRNFTARVEGDFPWIHLSVR